MFLYTQKFLSVSKLRGIQRKAMKERFLHVFLFVLPIMGSAMLSFPSLEGIYIQKYVLCYTSLILSSFLSW